MTMTLGEFSFAIDADPKWVQNAASAIGAALPFTLASARRLVVARALNAETGMPLARAYHVAERTLHRYDGSAKPVGIAGENEPVSVSVDVYRLLASLSAGLSRLAVLYAPKKRGRPARRRNPIRAAQDYGLDLTLLDANLRRSPAERLRLLDAMVAFRRRVRRGAQATTPRRVRRHTRAS